MAGTAHLRLILAAALVVLAVLAARPVEPPAAPTLKATAAGDVRVTSTAADQAILDAHGLKPGDTATGSLAFANRTAAGHRMRLRTVQVVDTPGPAGGLLSGHLQLRITRASGSSVHEVFSGAIAELGDLDLGPLPAGREHVYTFAATVPEHGPAVDDAFAGGSVEVAWQWEAKADAEPEPPVAKEPPDTSPAPAQPQAEPASPRADDGRTRSGQSLADEEGPAPATSGPVRLWAAAAPNQRLRGKRPGLRVLVRCRPGCAVTASAKVRVGRRWITLRGRALGTVAHRGTASALTFRLSPAEARRLRRAIRRGRSAPVRLTVHAASPGHVRAGRTLALRLRR